MSNNILLWEVNVDTDGEAVKGDGGSKQLIIQADNFGGGVVTIQTSFDKIIWVTMIYNGVPAVFPSNISLYLNRIGQGAWIRATLTGSLGASNVSAVLCQ